VSVYSARKNKTNNQKWEWTQKTAFLWIPKEKNEGFIRIEVLQ